jgi:hypothetical protein
MNKQEFLAMSLPHGVYLQDDAHISKLEGIVQGCYLIDYNEIGTEERDEVFPILHPLSDLTKEIEHKGEKFVPIEKIQEIRGIVTVNQYFINDFKQSIRDKSISFDLVLILCKWHFNLMDDGEGFVDVNTLPENPYK